MTLPGGTAIPDTVTVKSVTLSAKATGLKTGDTITLTDGQATVTIKAEDGTTKQWTLTLTLASEVAIEELVIGDRWAAFTLSGASAAAGSGQYYFGIKPKSAGAAPTESEMTAENDLNVKTYTVGTDPINVILATTLNSPLVGFFSGKWNDANTKTDASGAVWTDTDITTFTDAGANAMTGADEFSARRSMLTPETEYDIYIRKEGESTVSLLYSFTTAATDTTTATTPGLELLSAVDTLLGNTITAHRENWEIVPLQLTAALDSTDPVFTAINSQAGVITLIDALGINPDLVPPADPQFFYYVGDAGDYAGSERLLGLRGLYFIFQGEQTFYPIRMFYTGNDQVDPDLTIDYQGNS